MRRESSETPRRAKKGAPPKPLGEVLLPWYRDARRRLPWREHPSPYSVWVSEVMLQQTRVETVIPYYARFLERFPTLEALAAAPLEDVLSLWSGLGYYRRARSLHAGARAVAEKHGGCFPRTLESALEIPGVGPYTGGAILSIAYNLPVPVVDGNVERVLTRLLRIEGNPKQADVARRLRAIALESIPEGRASDFNQALMELGAIVCTPVSPACGRCPLATACLARRHGDAIRFPESPPGRKTVAVTLHAAVVRDGGRYLLERVTEAGFLEGLWLFPFVETGAEGSAPDARLISRLERRLGQKPRCAGLLGRLRHAITFRRIAVAAFLMEVTGRPSRAAARRGLRWARLDELGSSVPVSSIVLKIARRLLGGIPGEDPTSGFARPRRRRPGRPP